MQQHQTLRRAAIRARKCNRIARRVPRAQAVAAWAKRRGKLLAVTVLERDPASDVGDSFAQVRRKIVLLPLRRGQYACAAARDKQKRHGSTPRLHDANAMRARH